MTEAGNNRPYVFLSYSHNDKDKVQKIYRKLAEKGVCCWIDEKIRAMENFNSVIEEAIAGCTIFLSFFSRSYVQKQYCQMEYDCATNHCKSKVIVCIDDVSPTTNLEKKYMFSYYTGLSILGYGMGVRDDDKSIDAFCQGIINSPRFNYLRRYTQTQDQKFLPPVTASEELMACLRLHTERQYHQNGNYVFSGINGDLFPEIIEMNEEQEEDQNTNNQPHYLDPTREQVSLVRYLTSSDRNSGQNVFLIGEGGNGKTVSLLQTCEYLLNQKRCAVYIPIKELGDRMGIEEYVYRNILARNDTLKADFDDLMKSPGNLRANVVFLLDGVNEVEYGDFNKIALNIQQEYINLGHSVQFILTSRFDSRKALKLKDFTLLKLQPLSELCIREYLEKNGCDSDIDQKLMSVLRTPLLLTLYANTEIYRERYQLDNGIGLEQNPNTAGKVLGNFFQTQLYRASEEVTFNLAEQLVILEFLLPLIAYRMTEKKNGFLDEDEAFACADEVDSDSVLFHWYKKKRLRKLNHSRKKLDSDFLFRYAEDSLHFIHATDQGYEFVHQSFRDYFAAYHVANEIRAINADNDDIDELGESLTKRKLSEDILHFVSDILREEEAAPRMEQNGWVFPGKTGTKPSKFSAAEQLLELWRDEEGENAQNAVYNLLNIMKIGRNNLLMWCDFSGLDLRKCWLNQCQFVDWYEDKVYPSVFDNAWLDRESFINNGHDSGISAICTDEHSRIFSGNRNGAVKVYDLDCQEWTLTIQPDASPVIDLAWDEGTQVLAILYADVLVCYALAENEVTFTLRNQNRSKSFRYVRFAADAAAQVSYDLEPLMWYTTEGVPVTSDLEFDVPARCARWHPFRKEFVRSNLLQLVSVYQYDEEHAMWVTHRALQQRLAEENLHRMAEGEPAREFMYISLRDEGAESKDSANCIVYRPDGKRFLVAIQNLLIEYDAETLLPVRKKSFGYKIKSVCYGNGTIIAAGGINIFVLDEDFSLNATIRGTQIRSVRTVVESYDQNGYYLISDNGEFKKLDQNLNIRRIRTITSKTTFVWTRDRRTGRIQMAFRPNNLMKNGMRYTYETGQSEPLGWCYEFLGNLTDNEDQQIYLMGNRLMVVEKTPPYNTVIYENYTGIWIFDCSFRGIRGNLSTRNNQEFIRQNGGITDDITD